MLEPGIVKAGDEVLVCHPYGRREIVQVVKITPTGQIVLPDKSRFRPNGSEIGGVSWRHTTLAPVTPDARKEVERKTNISLLESIKWQTVAPEKLIEIIRIVRQEKGNSL